MQIHIRVFGRVQGVGFRAWTVHQAENLHLFGFVRNRRDGSVEIYATGATEALNELLKRCHQGPAFARVDKIVPVSYPDAPMPVVQNIFTYQPTV